MYGGKNYGPTFKHTCCEILASYTEYSFVKNGLSTYYQAISFLKLVKEESD